MEIIHVPDIEGPTEQLCWQQYNPTEQPFTHAMERCTMRKGHAGPHVWEYANALDTLTAENATLRADLDNWRLWAQFIYLKGGPITLADEELRPAVCAAHDADLDRERLCSARLRAEDAAHHLDELAKLRADLARLQQENKDLLREVLATRRRRRREG